ncbi:MAG: efflux transporter periplasmic adaptor subunit [gamma proteobacterium symbiont of Ctena orbiculata]|uniref:Efflux RND transporter periplasmic adaptor subunit n=1 Tax=Candidatus Thiodiazotropha taylori TaxID=2792791 RepID=A0A944QRX3_9GAMM|nr:efflux RND transporter periplasmic adaptor subunit [Candidatus Thiodiazotropha taylori]PUB89304.1 MAG: efflux transporter periplasmic adaptor subunit [gamma proteobacterium symbiont of Ctena orbiculata]MBT3028642.1 efflux RND transporter periplasmic adaptor subunit [Candidatus Thiodiazotropha taylori]MBT3036271.1 efflux RND transporter periplasmic adaptor subunit [Candidatus Thiodiazotropha taylori]MBV2138334.1 efflux RND transporter periplasmic adaptor subunit [Candidatus Thiodiazotropha ta
MRRLLVPFILSLGLMPALSTAETGELDTVAAVKREAVREFWLDGVVEAINQTTLSAQTRGQVKEILFDVDDYVEKGQVVVQLKDTEQKAGLDQARADLKEAAARLQESQDNFKRTKDLFGRKLASQSQLDKATAALKSAKARREAADARLAQANEQFEYTRIKAPYSGIVTHRHVEVGEIASPGQKLMSGISLDQLRVTVELPQSLIPVIRKQGKARVLLSTGEAIEGQGLTIFPFADQSSNTFKVRVDLPQGIADLFPGMFVKTAFVTGVKKELVVPAGAVVYRSEVTAVYVVGKQGRVHFRHIRAGHPVAAEMLSVIAGLSEGERVATDPVAAAKLLKQQLAEGRDG